MSNKKHPRGIWILSSVEMWERFSFYSMQSLLVLYAVAKSSDSGLGWSNVDALRLTGYYGALVYASPLIGGWVADYVMGRKVAVLVGSIIMMGGHAALAFHGETALFIGIALLVIGCGLMKPTISALVGEFFSKEDKTSKESAFAIFYMAINIGGVAGPFLAGIVQQHKGFQAAFAMAAFGLLIGIINYLWFLRSDLATIGNLPTKNPMHIPEKLDKVSWQKAKVYLAICVTNILWNIFYALPYGLLTLYAENNIDRHFLGYTIPSGWYYALYGLFIILFSPVVVKFYKLVEYKFHFTLNYKLSLGYVLVSLGALLLLPLVKNISHDAHFIGSSWYLVGFYALFAFSELLTVPVLLSAASDFAPKRYVATFVSLNMAISWAIGAWAGGEFGVLTQTMDASLVFKFVIGACLLFALLHMLVNKFVENILAK